jgi:hypothetical protein
LNFANSLDKNDKTLWNKTDGSPKIKLFKEHFGDEFNIKRASVSSSDIDIDNTVSLCVFGRYAPFEATILSIALENIRTSLDSS